MRHAARTDDNQDAIVKALRSIGAKVHLLKKPVDLLVWHHGRTFLMEVKNPDGFNTLTKEQVEFIKTWPGELHVVRGPIEAINVTLGKEVMR